MRINVEDALFCLVDVQDKLYPHVTNKDEIEKNLVTLVKGLKVLDVPFIVNEQYKKGIGETIPSLKDVPTQFEDGLQLAAVTKRFDPRDAILSNKYTSIEDLPQGAVVGTTSLRRRMAIKMLRPDIVLKDLRGNINTRIAKLNAGEYDAIILAATGIQKLQIENEVKYFSPISTDVMIPSMGQATLGIETTNDPKVLEIVKVLNDRDAHIESTIERSFVDTLQGGCQVPIGVKATIIDENSIRVQAIVGLPDGTESISEDITVDIKEFETLGQKLAQIFIDQGARELLDRAEKLAFK